MITVFYDGQCGLCSKEINHYKKVAAEGIFDWQDVTRDTTVLKQEGISVTQALKSLHARDNNGNMHIGVDAFILIWRQLPRWKVLAFWVGLPGIKQLASLAYKAFATWHFKKQSHCGVVPQTDNNNK